MMHMQRYTIWPTALVLGFVAAVLLRAFELCVNNGTNWIWNDVFRSDQHRWVVVPLAVGLSVLFGLVVRWLGQKRIVSTHTDALDDAVAGPATMREVGVILVIGLASLLAGASLGPEAALMTGTATIGAWAADRTNLAPAKRLLVLASVGALLVAFLGSMLLVLVPLLLLLRERKLNLESGAVVVLASLSSFAALQLIDHRHPGYGQLPTLPRVETHDFLVALVAGFSTTVLALFMVRLIGHLSSSAKQLNGRIAWPYGAALFGLGIGLLYLWGGETVQFSGNVGGRQLAQQSAALSAWTLCVVIIAKLVVTAWSKATGYRGGLVFPSIYVGIALGLLISRLLGTDPSTGAIVGSIAGMLNASTGSAVVGAIFLLAILPLKVVLVGLLAIAGSVAGHKLLARPSSTTDVGAAR